MKKINLLLILIGLSPVLKAENTPLSKNGTTWQYLYTSLANYSCYSCVADGDTVANGHTYKKVYSYSTRTYNPSKAKLEYAFREEGQKIYALPNDINNKYLPEKNGEVLLYDFSLQEGDKFPILNSKQGGCIVNKVDSVEINGRKYKQISFSGIDIWVEGIGSLSRPFGYPLFPLANNGEATTLEMLKQDGQFLYGNQRFDLLTDGVHWTERTSSQGSIDENDKEIFELNYFYVKGDSIINGISYKKVYVNDSPYMAIREDEDGNIYYHNSNVEQEGLLYQFRPQFSNQEELHYTDETGKDQTIVASSEYVPNTLDLADGHRYVCLLMTESAYYYTYTPRARKAYLIYGVGLTQGIFQHILASDIDCVCYNDLISIYDSKNNLVYQNPAFTHDGEYITSDIPSIKAEKKLRITTQGREVTFHLTEFPEKSNPAIYVYGTDGSLMITRNLESGAIKVSLPSGTYIYRLQMDNANAEAGRFSVGK